MTSNLEKAIKADIGYSEKAHRLCKNCDRFYTDKNVDMTENNGRCSIYAKGGINVVPTASCNSWMEKQLRNL